MKQVHVKTLVIGAGPAGLTTARHLVPKLGDGVLVVDRERESGGVPRHCNHPGYGMRDLRRILTGPDYARRLTQLAVAAGARIQLESMVTDWAGDRELLVTTPTGRQRITADAVVVATGARERPRPARWIPGDRSAGILTTGQLQQSVHLKKLPIGKRAVVVGAELVSWSAVMTLRKAGVKTVAMVTRYPKPESYALFNYPGRVLTGTRVETESKVVRILGKPRVEALEIEELRTGARKQIACDTVIFTGDWIPDHELIRSGGLDLSSATAGPVVDSALRCSRPGIFAAGNLIHPVDTADGAALDGKHVAQSVLAYLDGASASVKSVNLSVNAPLRWITPSVLRSGDGPPARNRLLAWADDWVQVPRVTATQDGRQIGSQRLAWPLAPGRVFRIPAGVVRDVDWFGSDIEISVH